MLTFVKKDFVILSNWIASQSLQNIYSAFRNFVASLVITTISSLLGHSSCLTTYLPG
jgi:hypothetical protein